MLVFVQLHRYTGEDSTPIYTAFRHNGVIYVLPWWIWMSGKINEGDDKKKKWEKMATAGLDTSGLDVSRMTLPWKCLHRSAFDVRLTQRPAMAQRTPGGNWSNVENQNTVGFHLYWVTAEGKKRIAEQIYQKWRHHLRWCASGHSDATSYGVSQTASQCSWIVMFRYASFFSNFSKGRCMLHASYVTATLHL